MLNFFAVIFAPSGMGVGDDIFQGFAEVLSPPCHSVYHFLIPITLFLAFAGLLMAAYKVQMGGDLGGLGTQLVLTLVIAVCIGDSKLPRWILDSTEILASSFNSMLNFSVGDVFVEYLKWLGIMTGSALPGVIVILAVLGAFGFGTGFIAVGAIAILLIATPWILLGLSYGAVLVGYLTQIAVVYIGISVLPIFLGMLLYEQTRGTGVRYIQGLVGILFWPLGWGIGFFVIHAIVKEGGPLWNLIFSTPVGIAMVALNVVLAGVLGCAIGLLLTGMLLGVVTKAPQIIGQAIATGSQVGTGIATAASSGGGGAVSSTFSAAAGIAQTAATSGGGGGGGGSGSGGGVGITPAPG